MTKTNNLTKMTFKIPGRPVRLWLLVGALCLVSAAAWAANDLKFEILLVWATNDSKSPDPKHKPVEADIRKKLNDLPFKWANFFEVNRKSFQVPVGGNNSVALSEKCRIEVKSLGKSKIEVTHFGKEKQTWTGTQSLPKGDTLLIGGNAPNATSWLVVLKRVE